MKKIKGLEVHTVLTKGDMVKLKVFRHPHRHKTRHYPYSLPLKRRITFQDTKWLNENTTKPYSIDSKTAISFMSANDAMKIKLMWWGDLIG